jgi:hypothetical protein
MHMTTHNYYKQSGLPGVLPAQKKAPQIRGFFKRRNSVQTGQQLVHYRLQ